MCLQVLYIFLFSSLHLAIRGQNVKSTTSLSKPADVEVHSKAFTPTLVVNAEGGSVPTDDISFKILNNDPPDNNKNSHVKPRKEALLNKKSPATGISSEKDKNNASKPSESEIPHKPTKTPIESTKNLKPPTNISNSTGDAKIIKPTQHGNKPLILFSSDTLNSAANSNIKSNKLHDLKSSSNPIDSDQIPSPNQQVPNKSFYSSIATRGPSMVIPIVISLLMLPVVAVLGYVGLKKGKEAWKNRHYKRMDFLLDGMYNE